MKTQHTNFIAPDEASEAEIDEKTLAINNLSERINTLENKIFVEQDDYSVKTLEAEVEKLTIKLKGKADTTRVEELEKAVKGKADESMVDRLSDKISSKAASKSVKELQDKVDEIEDALDNKADKGSVGVSAGDLNKVKDTQDVNTGVWLITVSLFNIFAIWFIICRPDLLSPSIKSGWTFILPLISITLINIASYFIWLNRGLSADIDCAHGLYIIDLILLILNLIVIWVFAFHPVNNVQAIVMAIFLTISNVLMLYIRGSMDSNRVDLSITAVCWVVAFIMLIVAKCV